MKYLLFNVLLVAVVIAAGCVGGNKETVVTPTPTPQIVYVTVLVTPTPTATLDAVAKQTTIPVLTISATCNDLVSSVKDDLSFLDFVDNSKVISRTYMLAYDYDNCDANTASQINQEIIKTNAKPKTPSMLQALQFLISATTHCVISNSASMSRTKDDMEKFGNKLEEYSDVVTSCQNLNNEDFSVLSKVIKEYDEVISLPTTQTVISLPTTQTFYTQTGPVCNANYGWYRYGSQWTVYGTVINNGASGKCEIEADLLASNGEELEQRMQILSLSSGEFQSFTMDFVDTTNRGGRIKASITVKE